MQSYAPSAESRRLIDRLELMFHRTLDGAATDRVAFGLLGSYARGDETPVSDLDCFIIFDDATSASSLTPITPSALVGELERAFELGRKDFPDTPEISTFWATVTDLARGCYHEGRFPAYDRLQYIHNSRHLAGKVVPPSRVKVPSKEALFSESARFALNVLKRKLDNVQFFDRLPHLDATGIAMMGPVVLTKAILMPVRILYLLDPQFDERPVVCVEEAASRCRAHSTESDWWALVRAATAWRRAGPAGAAEHELAAQLVRRHIGSLYRDILTRIAEGALHAGLSAEGQLLRQWRDSVRGY